MPTDSYSAPGDALSPVMPAASSGPAATTQHGSSSSRALDGLRADLFDADETDRIQATRRRIAEDDLYVVAIGEFKRGKSTLLNALIGRPILPVGVVPLTSVVTVLRREAERAVANLDDGTEISIDPERLAEYVTEEGNPGNRQRLARVDVCLPELDLPRHVALIDTPGLGSVYESGTDHTLGFLPQLDVALVVLSVDQPLTEAEARLASRLRDQGAELLFVVNKTDYLTQPEIDEALAFVADRLAVGGFSQPLVLGTSAKTALQGGLGSGVPELRERLSELVEARYESIHAAQSARRVEALLDELETTYAVRAEIVDRGEQDLNGALRELRQSRKRVDSLAEKEDAVFAHRIQAAERRLSEHMLAFQARLQKDLLAVVDEIDRPDEAPSEDRVDERFSAVIAPLLGEALETEGAILETTLREAYERLLMELDELAASLARQTEEILGVRIARPGRSETEELSPTVTVKLRDDPVGLEMLTGALQSPLPKRLRRHLLVRRSRERAAELADRHAGRLRSELATSLREATRAALRDAHAEIDSLSSSIERAIERGMSQRRLAAVDAQEARNGVAAALDSIRAARAELGSESSG